MVRRGTLPFRRRPVDPDRPAIRRVGDEGVGSLMAKRKPPLNTAPPAGLGTGSSGAMSTAPTAASSTVRVGVGVDTDWKQVVQRRHQDWKEHHVRWPWLLDSLEGGDRYRNATYGPDRRGLPLRNLQRHKREYPDAQQFPNYYQGYGGFAATVSDESIAVGSGPYPGQLGADPLATAMDDDYELRRARTPVPEFVAEALETHLAKVYDQEVDREAPDDLLAWWKDVDGCGTPIDDYMRETLAPLLLVLGTIDVVLDYPVAPPGAKVETRADEIALGLDKVVASYILPQNMVWWRNDAAGRYVECLVREYVDAADRMDLDADGNSVDLSKNSDSSQQWRRNYIRWRLWRRDESILLSFDGSEIISRTPHTFGHVPIVRLIDQKKHRTRNVGKSRYEAIAEYQREFYNRDSELILSDTLQAHPFLSGPEDYCKADNTLSVGPGYLLPKKKNPENGSYEGFDYVSPPKDPAESLRKNKQDLIDLADRRACLAKPAGADSPGTVGQSGISKQLDQHTGHKLLTAIARSLAKAERQLAEFAAIALRSTSTPYRMTPEDREKIVIAYPAKFDLMDAANLIDSMGKLALLLPTVGNLPEVEQALLSTTIRGLLVGLTDDEYRSFDDEIELLVTTRSQIKEQTREMAVASILSRNAATEGPGSAEQAAGNDPTGESAGTAVSGIIPAVP
ncbi:MAG: hypothetical protein ACYDCI_00105 [Candidatus Limnocylindrales bacterium]